MSENLVLEKPQQNGAAAVGPATASAPASIANFFHGFDAVGLAIGGLVCRVTLEVALKDELTIEGRGAILRPSWSETIIGWTVSWLREATGFRAPLSVRAVNEIPLGRGLGSSAAMAVAAVKAFRHLVPGPPRPSSWWLAAAFEAERQFGGDHWDNVQPAFFGGLTIRHPLHPERCLVRPPPDLHLVVAVPNERVPRLPRHALPDAVPRQKLVASLAASAWAQATVAAGRSDHLVDCIGAGPYEETRADHLPYFHPAAQAAREVGARAFVSGGGPTIAAAAASHAAARDVLAKWQRLPVLKSGLCFITRGLAPFVNEAHHD